MYCWKGGIDLELMGLPVVQVLLVAMIFLALMVEIKTGGLGLGALFGLIGAGVFFGSQFIHGLVSLYEIALFLGGIIFISIELLTPGIGLFAGIGMVAILYSFILALGGDSGAVYLLFVSLVIAIIIFALILKKLPSSKLWEKFILKDMSTSNKGYVSAQDYTSLLDQEGLVITELRPAGTAMFQDRQVDVVSEGQYIEKNAKIKVVLVNGSRIVVKKIN